MKVCWEFQWSKGHHKNVFCAFSIGRYLLRGWQIKKQITRVRMNVNILNRKKIARRAIKSPPLAENFLHFTVIIWVETLNSRWKQSIKYHSFTLQTWSQQDKWNSQVFFHVLHKVLHRKNSKMRFPWHRDNGKIDRISQSQYA